MFMGPIVLATLALLLRRKLIFDRFLRVKDHALHMGRMIYDNHANSYHAVDINDLLISEENSAEFNAETAHCIRLSDVDEMGRIVNIRVYSRLS